jgi:hypothetical protein
MLGLDNARQVEVKRSRVGLGSIDVEYPMGCNGDRAILVVGRLL